MLILVTTKQFERDFKKALKSGKSKQKISEILKKLVNQEPLEVRYKDHPLRGIFKGRRECHIEPDLLLIYKIESDRIIMERMGSHSELFD